MVADNEKALSGAPFFVFAASTTMVVDKKINVLHHFKNCISKTG